MYSAMANRKCLSPSGTNRSRHSLLIESTNRSAKAFRFGLCAGNLTVLTPAWSRVRRNACVYNGSRSSSRYRLPSKNPDSRRQELKRQRQVQGCLSRVHQGATPWLSPILSWGEPRRTARSHDDYIGSNFGTGRGHSKQSQQKPNDGGENSGSAVEPGDRLERLLPVLIDDLDGDDWAEAAPLPGRDRGTGHGEASQAFRRKFSWATPIVARAFAEPRSRARPAPRWRWARDVPRWLQEIRGPEARCRSSKPPPWIRRSSRLSR